MFSKIKKTVFTSQFYVFMLLSSSILINACNSEHIQRENEGPHIKNGVMVFQDKDEFDQVIGYLNKNQDNLDQWRSQFNNYYSLNEAFEDLIISVNEKDADIDQILQSYRNIYTITSRAGEEELIRITDDNIIASVFNQDGLIVIGNDLKKLTYEFLYTLKDFGGYENVPTRVFASVDHLKTLNAEITPIINEVKTINSKNGRRIETCSNNYKQKGKRKRVKGEIFENKIFGLYASVGARTKHQKKIAGIWFANDTKQIRLKVDGTFTQKVDGITIVIPVDFDKTNTNDNKIDKTFEFCLNVDCKFDVQEMYNLHWCNCDDGRQRQCETEES